MKDRLLTLALAAAAFVLFYAFFVPKPPDSRAVELPTSREKGDAGYQALWRWLESTHIPIASLQDTYTHLTARPVATGNVLITTLPHRLPARRDELNALDAWVSRGNTLVVMAALDDTPRWAVAADASFLSTLGRMTRIGFEASDPPPMKTAAKTPGGSRTERAMQAMQRLLEPQRIVIDPKGAHPLFEGVNSVLAVSEFPASRWRASSMDASPLLEIGQRPAASPVDEPMEPAIWLKRQGAGQILICGFASVFSNKLLAEHDNARLLSNIVAWSRTADGAVIVDDAHQGLVSYYDAKAFFGDPRLHRSLWWIVLSWLLFVMGWRRLRPASDPWNPLDVTTLIGVTGGFFASVLSPAAAAMRLFENFFNRVRRRLDLPEDGTPVWRWLAADARVPASQLLELQQLHAKARAGKRVDLVRLQNSISRLTGILE